MPRPIELRAKVGPDYNFDCNLIPIDFTKCKDSIFEQKNKKIGRNDPCPCGSGKKYKKCCGK